MNYRLVVLTHGDEPDCAVRTLDSFAEHVTPAPAEFHVIRDGPGYSYVPLLAPRFSCRQIAEEQVGFCAATAWAWKLAAQPGPDYVFWLEHDFEVTRLVDLTALAAVLDEHPSLAQMALMRDAVNDAEKAAGGLYESRPGQYERRYLGICETCGELYDKSPDLDDRRTLRWLEHRAYLTTNPSLMRRDFMAENPWPDPGIVPEQCEGRFGLDLVQDGWRFGAWGNGEPWCHHIGTRDGFGY